MNWVIVFVPVMSATLSLHFVRRCCGCGFHRENWGFVNRIPNSESLSIGALSNHWSGPSLHWWYLCPSTTVVESPSFQLANVGPDIFDSVTYPASCSLRSHRKSRLKKICDKLLPIRNCLKQIRYCWITQFLSHFVVVDIDFSFHEWIAHNCFSTHHQNKLTWIWWSCSQTPKKTW